MSTNNRKVRITDLAADLQGRDSHEAVSIKELVGLLIEEAKDSLLTQLGEELIRAQGGAQALDRLHKLLTIPKPKMQQMER